MRYVSGILVFLVFLFLLIALASGFNVGVALMLFDLATAIFFKAAVAAVIISTGGLKVFVMAINAILSKSYKISSADREKAVRLFKLIRKTIIYTAVLHTIIGVLLSMMQLSDIHAFMANLAISFLSIFYGALANMLLVNPAISILESRENVDEKIVISEKQVIDKMLELCYKQGVSPEEILNASEISFRRGQ